MKKEILLAVPNSVIFVADRDVGETPQDIGDSLVASTSSCIAVGTLCQIDGETLILLYDEPANSDSMAGLVFDGFLDTPSGQVCIFSVLDERLLESNITGPRCRVQVWVNDESEPDEIRVFVTAAA